MNFEALQHYFSFQYVPEPMTLNENINIVEPGTYFVRRRRNQFNLFVIGK